MIDKNLIEFLDTTPTNLAEKQYEALRFYAISVLEDMIKDIKNEVYDTDKLAFSNAGDGYGDDNFYIPFYIKGKHASDIGDVFNKLVELRKIKSIRSK